MNLALPFALNQIFRLPPSGCEDRSALLTASQLAAVERSLTNPAVRVPLRADFPPVLSFSQPLQLLEVIEHELAKRNESLQSVGEICVIYPNKDPRVFLGHSNTKGETACYATMRALKSAWKDIGRARHFPARVLSADMISETVYLDRSHNQGSLHALTMRQQYVARKPWYRKQIPFLREDHAARAHYFIIADQYIEQGTTVANLASYITHNGGYVLAAVHGEDSGTPLVPKNTFGPFEGQHTELKGVFGAAANNRSLAALGFFLARAAEREGVALSRDDALHQVEEAINQCGHSLTALTHVETQRLIKSLQLRHVTYRQLKDVQHPKGPQPLIAQHPRKVAL